MQQSFNCALEGATAIDGIWSFAFDDMVGGVFKMSQFEAVVDVDGTTGQWRTVLGGATAMDDSWSSTFDMQGTAPALSFFFPLTSGLKWSLHIKIFLPTSIFQSQSFSFPIH